MRSHLPGEGAADQLLGEGGLGEEEEEGEEVEELGVEAPPCLPPPQVHVLVHHGASLTDNHLCKDT